MHPDKEYVEACFLSGPDRPLTLSLPFPKPGVFLFPLHTGSKRLSIPVLQLLINSIRDLERAIS